MKTIFMFCRSEMETSNNLISILNALFPECQIHVIYESAESSALERKTSFASPAEA